MKKMAQKFRKRQKFKKIVRRNRNNVAPSCFELGAILFA